MYITVLQLLNVCIEHTINFSKYSVIRLLIMLRHRREHTHLRARAEIYFLYKMVYFIYHRSGMLHVGILLIVTKKKG